MTQTVTYDPAGANTALDAYRRPEDSEFAESAVFGAAESASIALDDDDAALTLVALKRLEVIEDAAPAGDQRLWTGFVDDRGYRRSRQVGPVGPNAREIAVGLVEISTILGDHIVRASSGNRPRESAGARLAWLLASGYVDCEDRGKVIYPATMMDATDYRGQFGGNVLADISTNTKYDFALLLDDEGETIPELFFDVFDRSEVYTSTVAISNAGDDDGETIFAAEEPGEEEELTRSGRDVASGGYGTGAKGSLYETKASTATAFRDRDMVVSSSQASTTTQLRRIIRNWLDDHDEEEDVVRAVVTVRAAQVNLIRRAHRIWVTLTFAPGLESGAWCRVRTRKVSQPGGHDAVYRIALELSPQAPVCVNPDEILAAHATVTGAVVAEAGNPTWAHATISGWFGGPVDTAVSTIPVNDPTNANDGDVGTYSGVDQQMLRGAGTVAARWEAALDGTYELCRIMGTIAVGSSQWRSFPPSRVEYYDPDAAAWLTLPGAYQYGPNTPPRYWTLYAGGVHATKIALVYEQAGVPGIAGLWGWMPLGIRVFDWLAYGDAV